MKLKIKTKVISNELIFLLFFWRLVILKPITINIPGLGNYIVWLYTSIILLLSLFHNYKKKIKFKKHPIYLFIFMFYSIFTLDLLMRPTIYIYTYMYEFLFYGVITVFLFLKIQNISRLLKIYSYFSIFLFIIFCLDPLNGFKYFNNYMIFGFQLVFPCFIGLNISYYYTKNKIIKILEFVCLIETIIYANRSCLLGIILYLFLKELLINNSFNQKTYKQFIKMIILFAFLAVLAFNIESIILTVGNYLKDNGISSYSFSQYMHYLNSGNFLTSTSTGGRSGITDQAIYEFLKSPIIGNGSGFFINKYGYYTHNIVTQLLVEHGIFIFILIASSIMYSIKRDLESKNIEFRLLSLLFFCLWCPKLFFSTYLFQDASLWIFLALSLSVFYKKYN